jgi:molecular chaperone DnaK (HSP70)
MVDLKNEADNAIHTTTKSLDEHRAKLNSTDIEEIEKEVSSLRTMLTDSAVSNEDLKTQINKVKEATMKIGKVLYSNAGAN